ncbi:MAG TPA: DsrE family protein [Steroidobacteraceae bacterium]|nr:DsrE family protein [Steroidobacteraceae bacterium]
MSIFSTLRSLLILSAPCLLVAAAPQPDATHWVYPVIKRYGGVHPRADLPTELAPGSEFKVIADVSHGYADRTHPLGSLQRLARLVNLFGYAHVPPERVHVVAVIEGEISSAVLTNDAYKRRFHVDNPNLDLLHELKRSGVKVMVCAQMLAENDVPDGEISPDVTVTLSALTDLAGYEALGYGYLQL